MSSEFGKGLCYNLGLFLAHTHTIDQTLEHYEKAGISKKRAYEMWFNAAGDHMYDFQPQSAPNKSLQKRCANFQDKVLGWRLMVPATAEDYAWAVQEAKDLLRLIDKANNVPSQKGESHE